MIHLKRMASTTLCLLICVGVFDAAHAQLPRPYRIGGTLTVGTQQILAGQDAGYTFSATRPDGTPYDPPATAAGLNSQNAYIINIPIYDEFLQAGGARPGETAVVNAFFNGTPLTVTDPPAGSIVVGHSGDGILVNLIVAESTTSNQPPEANAGPDQTVRSGETVTLNGINSQDPDPSDILTYGWVQLSGPSVQLSSAAVAGPTFTAPAPPAGQSTADLEFELTVTDDDGATDSDRVVVTVSALLPPTADPGPNQTVQEGDTVILDGTNSSDPDSAGVPLTYVWHQISGPSITLTFVSSGRSRFTAPATGAGGAALTFRLTVTDGDGLTASGDVIITVTRGNQPPTAMAGADQSVQPGDTVTLDGAGSSDPEGEALSFVWTQTEGPTVKLSSISASGIQFSAPDSGQAGVSLAFQLTVSDAAGLTDADQVTVNVAGSQNQTPAADAGVDQTALPGERVVLNGSNSIDPEGGALEYTWSQTAGIPVSLSDPTDITPSFIAPDPGAQSVTLVFQLVVTDAGGLTHTAETQVHLSATGQPPVADAGADIMVSPGYRVELDGTGSGDPDGRITTYHWQQAEGTIRVTLSNTDSPTASFTAPAVGTMSETLSFTLSVTDSEGLTDQDTVLVTVLHSSDIQPPVADAGPNRQFDEGTTGVLDGTGSYAPSGSVVRYQWKQTGGGGVTIREPASAKTVFFVPPVEEDAILIFELTVTDSNALRGTDTVEIAVKNVGGGSGERDTSCFLSTIDD